MQPQQQLREFLDRASITSEMERRGFRRIGQTWMRANAGVAHVIEFQRSRFSDPGSVKFTINVGVALDDVWRIYFGEALAGAIREADCFPRFRVGEAIGGFRGEAKDIWWTLREHDDVDKLATEVKSALLQTCIPILDRLDSAEAVFRFVQEEAPPRHPAPYTRIILAIIYHLCGNVDEATSMLAELEPSSKLGVQWRNRINEVQSRLRGQRESGK